MNEHLLYAERYAHISLSPHCEAGSIIFYLSQIWTLKLKEISNFTKIIQLINGKSWTKICVSCEVKNQDV